MPRHPLRLVLALLCLLAASGAAEGQIPDLIFVCSGQSNMVGLGDTAGLDAAAQEVPPNLTLWDAKKGQWNHLRLGARIGPDFRFGAEMARSMPGRVVGLVKHAVIGTSLLAWSPQWTKEQADRTQNGVSGPLYDQLKEQVQRARAAAPRAPVTGVIWMQGERDAKFPEAAQAYADNLTLLVQAFRRDFGDARLPVVWGQIKELERAKGCALVRQAQQELPQRLARTAMVGTEGVTLNKDNLHYSGEGQILLGTRFAEAMRRLLAETK